MISEKNDENRHQLRGQLPLLVIEVVEILRAGSSAVGASTQRFPKRIQGEQMW